MSKQQQLELDLSHVRKIDLVREFVDNNDHLGKLSEISRKLKIKEGTVSCYIIALRKQGYEIVAGPRGYTVINRPTTTEEVRTYGSSNRGGNHRFGAVWDGYGEKERDIVASDVEHIKASLEVERQARVAMNASIDQCRQVIAGIEIDGPGAIAHMEELGVRVDAINRKVKKLKSANSAADYLASSARTNGLKAMRAYHWTMIVLGSLISTSLLIIAIKL
jgi:biotin operon repressor